MTGLHALVLLAVIAIAPFSAAITISAGNEIAESVPWSFSVELDSANEFEKTTILLDNKPLLDVYYNSTINKDPFNGGFVLNAFTIDRDVSGPQGLVLYVTHPGLEKGSHAITAMVYNHGIVAGQTAQDIMVTNTFEKLTQVVEASQALSEKISQFSLQIEEMQRTTDASVLGNQAKLNETLSGLERMNASFNELASTLEAQKTRVQEQESTLGSVQAGLQKLEQATQEQELKSTVSSTLGSTALTGLSALIENSTVNVLAEFIAIAILLVFIKRKHKGNEMDLIDGMDDLDSGELGGKKRGPWSFKK